MVEGLQPQNQGRPRWAVSVAALAAAGAGGLAILLLTGIVFVVGAVALIWQAQVPRAAGVAPPYALLLPMLVVLLILLWLGWRVSQGSRPSRRYRRLVTAAEQGGPAAKRELGLAYLSGAAGHPKDETSARFHLQQAASLGDREAMLLLAQLLQDGVGGPRNLGLARDWRGRALEASSQAEVRAEAPGGDKAP